MGKVIARKINGMSWMARVSLVLVCTLFISVFAYEGWYRPGTVQAFVQTYAASGTSTWVAPAGVTSITVECWGGGGGGGGVNLTGTTNQKGGGGAGGQYAKSVITVIPGNSYTVVVGAAGAAGNTGAGGAGGDSTFASTTVVAKGGAGGAGTTTAVPGGAAGIGSTAGGVGTTVYAGGSGSAGGVTTTGGAGGGGAGSTGAGGNASSNSAGTGTATGGGAGAAGQSSSNNGSSGTAAGGGGGGGYRTSSGTRTGGAGAAGSVVLTYTMNGTTAGAATAVAISPTKIAVSMPYSYDDNANNSAFVEWQAAGSGLWDHNISISHVASPFAYTISGLSAGTSYDVRVTYLDPDGVTGTATQTLTNVKTGSIVQTVPWTNAYSGTSLALTGSNVTVPGGSNRVLLVGISADVSSGAAVADPTTIQYGGVALIKAADTGALSGRAHTWLYYLPENAVMDGTPHSVDVTFASVGNLVNLSVYTAAFSGVDSVATLSATGNSSSTSSSSTATLSSAMTIAAYDQPVYISSIYNTSSTPSYAVNSNWTSGGSNTTSNVKVEVANRNLINTGTTSDTAVTGSISPSNSYYAMSALSLKAYVPPPPGTTLANGVTVVAATVCPAATQKLNGFALINTNTGSDSVTGLTVTTTNGASTIASMQIWDEAGTTPYLVPLNAPTSGETWSFSGGTPIPVTAVYKGFKVVVTYKDRSLLPAGSTATTAKISSYSCSDASTFDTNAVQGAITVNNSAPTLAGTWSGVSGSSIRSNTPGTGDYVLVARYSTNTDTTMPAGGISYAVGSSFGNGGTIVNVSTAGTRASFTDAVPAAGVYYYRFFEYNSCITYATTSSWSSAVNYATISSISPSTLGQGVTADVYINGAGFVSGSTVTFSNSGITLNGSAAFVNSSQLKANVTVSASASGTSTVTVASSGSPSIVSASTITLDASPTVASASPNIPQGASSFPVTITGTGFQSGATVSFSGGDITASTAFVSSTRLTATVTLPASAALGARDVTVTNPDLGTATTFSAVTVIAPLYTVPGAVSFTQVTPTSMTVQFAYTGDSDGDNTCTITWGESNASYPNSALATKQGGKYSATITGLTGGADGAGKLYFFRALFSDADGVTGTNPVLGASSTKGNPLMHNSLNLGSDKWPQGWGVQEGKYGAFTCSTCHTRNTRNIKLIAGSLQSPSLENWSSAGNSNALAVSYLNPVLNMGNDAAHATSTNVCEVCHSRTDHHRYNNAAANHMGTRDCTSCHSHSLGFAPDSDGGQDCVTCHSTLNSGSYHHDLSSTGACLNCHADHNVFRSDLNSANTAGRAANLRADAALVPTAGLPATQSNTDFNATAVNGGLCVSCHLSPQTKPDATQTETLARDDFAASAHNFTVSSTFGRDNSTFLANCSKCHSDTAAKKAQSAGNQFSTHGSSAADILVPLGDTLPTASGFCFRCHSKVSDGLAGTVKPAAGMDYYGVAPMGRDAEGIYGAFQKTGSVHNQIQCSDCHNTHGAKPGAHLVGTNFAGPPLNGATGMTPSFPAFWTAPSSGNFAAIASIKAGSDLEAYVCLKCHSAAAGTLPTSPSGGFTMTDVAKEFNPNNRGAYNGGTYVATQTAGGFHPVFAYATNNLGAIKLANLVTTNFSWSKTTRNLMACSDCHGSDSTTDPSGPHGSAAKFLLRGPNTKWDNTLKLSGSGMPAGTFCANCHDAGFANSRFTSHTSNHSSALCLDCHAAIPHGGPRPGMLVAPVGVTATNVPAQMSDWDTNATYAGTGHKNYILSYPSTNTSNWSSSNCGCGGTGGM